MCDLVGTIVLLHIYAIKYNRVTPLLCRIQDSIISDIGENNRNEAKNIEHLQFSSVTQSCLTPCDQWTTVRQTSLSITDSWSLLKLMSIESVMPSNHFILYHLLLLLPSIFPNIRVISNESVLRFKWQKKMIKFKQSQKKEMNS